VQVAKAERTLKHKLRPDNAFFKALHFDIFKCVPKEELHQFLLGLFGDHIVPATMYEYTMALRRPDLVKKNKSGSETFLITNKMLENVWKRLRDRLASIKSSTSMIEISSEYASHFYDMYVQKHAGKHMTGDRVRILLLMLPFVFRDLIAPEVCDVYPI